MLIIRGDVDDSVAALDTRLTAEINALDADVNALETGLDNVVDGVHQLKLQLKDSDSGTMHCSKDMIRHI